MINAAASLFNLAVVKRGSGEDATTEQVHIDSDLHRVQLRFDPKRRTLNVWVYDTNKESKEQYLFLGLVGAGLEDLDEGHLRFSGFLSPLPLEKHPELVPVELVLTTSGYWGTPQPA